MKSQTEYANRMKRLSNQVDEYIFPWYIYEMEQQGFEYALI